MKFKSYLPVLFFSVVFSSCFEEFNREVPLLSDDKLQVVLKDIHLAESLLTEITDPRKKDSLARFYYEQIFFLHNIDSAQFNQSMNALLTDPPRLDSIYAKILKDLSKEQKMLRKD